jgi:uncharacterized protein (TIGR03086 family)
MTVVDLGPAAQRMSDLLRGVPDGLLGGPTPCRAYTLGDLIHHICGLTPAFTDAANKTTPADATGRAEGDAARLPSDWRTRIPRDLDTLAEAWRDPAAWTGMTRAGGVDMPGEVAAFVVLDELVVHGWDIARASGQPYDVDPGLLEATHSYLVLMLRPENEAVRREIFGPVVEVPDEAPLLDRVIGLSGRDPAWRPD